MSRALVGLKIPLEPVEALFKAEGGLSGLLCGQPPMLVLNVPPNPLHSVHPCPALGPLLQIRTHFGYCLLAKLLPH